MRAACACRQVTLSPRVPVVCGDKDLAEVYEASASRRIHDLGVGSVGGRQRNGIDIFAAAVEPVRLGRTDRNPVSGRVSGLIHAVKAYQQVISNRAVHNERGSEAGVRVDKTGSFGDPASCCATAVGALEKIFDVGMRCVTPRRLRLTELREPAIATLRL